jgi:hypothetical protein
MGQIGNIVRRLLYQTTWNSPGHSALQNSLKLGFELFSLYLPVRLLSGKDCPPKVEELMGRTVCPVKRPAAAYERALLPFSKVPSEEKGDKQAPQLMSLTAKTPSNSSNGSAGA